MQALDFVLPQGKLPESLELPGKAQRLPKGVCSEITQLRNNYCVGLSWECGRRGDGKELVSPRVRTPLAYRALRSKSWASVSPIWILAKIKISKKKESEMLASYLTH